jgi:hypothetical protein
MSNDQYAAAQAAQLGAGSGSTYGRLGLVATSGHAALRLQDANGNDVMFKGKYPALGAVSRNRATNELQWLLGRTAVGSLRNEFGMPQTPTWFNLNQAQFGAAASYLQGAPGRFSLSTNCSDWALQGVRTVGVGAPSNLTTFGFTDPSKIADGSSGGN